MDSQGSSQGPGRRLVYVVNHAAFFVSHRLPVARAAAQRGFKVGLLTGQAGSASMEPDAEATLAETAIAHTRVSFTSSGLNPLSELLGFAQLAWRLHTMRPAVVHCVSPKGVLYGGIAARLAGCRCLILAVSGMGYAFTDAKRPSTVRSIVSLAYRFLAGLAYGHRNKRVIVQNLDDEAAIVKSGYASREEVRLIPGSGVDLTAFVHTPIEAKEQIVLFPARMLADKGLLELVNAARLLKGKVSGWRFFLAGVADYQNPSSISRQQIQQWQQEGLVEWLGHVADMAPVFARASIVCLPSYREGMPKALLEAAAAGCAVVTTDVTGCREAILPGVTGDLVPVRDSQALAQALLQLMNDTDRRQRYGKAGRQLAIERFGIEAVVDATLAIYDELLKNERPPV